MRILVLTLGLPFPPSSGYRLHNWRLIQALAAEGHEVVLVSLVAREEAGEDVAPLQQYLQRLETVPFEVSTYHQRSYWQVLRALGSSVPYSALRYRSAPLAAALQSELSSGRFDVVISDQIYGVMNLPAELQTPVIVDTVHVAYLLLERYARHFHNPLKRVYSWIEARKMRKWEAGICRRVAAVGVCSNVDGELFRALAPKARLVSIPNVVDVKDYSPGTEGEAGRLLYCGAMDWYPNEDAVTFFTSAIFPAIRRAAPHATLRVAGRSPTESFRAKVSSPGSVEFTGTVPDMRPEFAGASVFVVPLRIAGGTRIKILEAAAMAKPIVSTSVGAEGLDFVNGEEILLADDPRDFADSVASLLADPARRERLGAAARRRVEQQYSMTALRRALREALDLVTLQRAPAERLIFKG